jgi:plasmid stabilization system protein ParE
MNLEFLPPATVELEDAVAYYNSQSEGLGFEFAAEVRRTLDRIVQYPDAWQSLSPRTRRCRTSRFPYGVVYQVRDDLILIVAVMHLHQNPRLWVPRLKILR